MGRVRVNLRAWEASMGHYVIEIGSQNRNEEPVVHATLREILASEVNAIEVETVRGEDCSDTIYEIEGQEIYFTSDHDSPVALVTPSLEIKQKLVGCLMARFDVDSEDE